VATPFGALSSPPPPQAAITRTKKRTNADNLHSTFITISFADFPANGLASDFPEFKKDRSSIRAVYYHDSDQNDNTLKNTLKMALPGDKIALTNQVRLRILPVQKSEPLSIIIAESGCTDCPLR